MTTNRRKFMRGIAGIAALPAISKDSLAETNTPGQANLSTDPLRPQFHLMPARNWMNDPNGPIYWKGKYHMFFQYNPHEAVWGDMHWAHAMSDDMVHWKHLPIALAPTPDGPDSEGVFSGSAAVMDGKVYMMYTGVRKSDPIASTIPARSWRETQCLAVANDDDLLSFTKVVSPVIASPPPGMQVNGFRDPSPWKQDGWWYTPIACGFPNVGGAILLYRSRDLRNWEFVHTLTQKQPDFESFAPWDVWECPEFFELGKGHVLLFSTMGKAYWQTGHLDTKSMSFHPEMQGILDYGSYYAPKTQLDASGNRILWGWIQETRSQAEMRAAGWSGMMSLPRVMELGDDWMLRFRVADQVETLRRNERSVVVNGDTTAVLKACCGEVAFIASLHGGAWTLELTGKSEVESWFNIAFNPARPTQIVLDRHPLEVGGAEEDGMTLRFYIDSSVIELIVNERVAWTKRFYYEGPQQDMVLRWRGNQPSLGVAKLWEISPITSSRLTA